MEKIVTKHLKKLFVPAFILVAFSFFNMRNIYAYTTENYSSTKVVNVNNYKAANGNNCTNISGMYIVGSKLYCIKTASTEDTTTLFTFSNFPSSSEYKQKVITSNGTSPINMGHANGMTYYKNSSESKGYLYISSAKDTSKEKNNQVFKVDPDTGKVVAKYKAFNNNKHYRIFAITYFRDNAFIVRISNSKDANTPIQYAVARIEGNNFTFGKIFSVSKQGGYVNYQDIHFEYANKQLYLPTYERNSAGNIKLNKILTVDLTSSVVNGKTYEANKVLTANSTKSTTTKYEIECVDVVNGVLYATANYEGKDPGNQNKKWVDGIFKLTKK